MPPGVEGTKRRSGKQTAALHCLQASSQTKSVTCDKTLRGLLPPAPASTATPRPPGGAGARSVLPKTSLIYPRTPFLPLPSLFKVPPPRSTLRRAGPQRGRGVWALPPAAPDPQAGAAAPNQPQNPLPGSRCRGLPGDAGAPPLPRSPPSGAWRPGSARPGPRRRGRSIYSRLRGDISHGRPRAPPPRQPGRERAALPGRLPAGMGGL